MKINNVRVLNWEEPGDKWWEKVARFWREPMIECQMTMTLSFREYINLLEQARNGSDQSDPLP